MLSKLFRLLCLMLPLTVYADCEYFTAADAENFVLSELSGTLQMQIDREVGEVIYRSSSTYVVNDNVPCKALTQVKVQGPHGASSADNDVLRLKLDDRTDLLGVRVLWDGEALAEGDNFLPLFGSRLEGDIVVEFVKLSEDLNTVVAGESPAVVSGKLLDIQAARCEEGEVPDRRGSCTYYDTFEHIAQLQLGVGQLVIEPATCSVEVDPIVVQLPLVYTSSFNAVGSVAGLTAFDMEIKCSAEDVGLKITLDSNHKNNDFIGVMNSVRPGTVRNIGVQLLDSNEVPVVFGEPISLGQTESTMNVLFHAQYFQTRDTVSAGGLTTSATYTFTYD